MRRRGWTEVCDCCSVMSPWAPVDDEAELLLVRVWALLIAAGLDECAKAIQPKRKPAMTEAAIQERRRVLIFFIDLLRSRSGRYRRGGVRMKIGYSDWSMKIAQRSRMS